MKKYILFASMALAALNVNAQKLEKPEIDKISGSITVSTKEEILANPFVWIRHFLACSIIKGRGYYAIYFHLREGLETYYKVAKGDMAVIKFTDGSLMQISAIFDEYSSGTVNETGSTVAYDLTESDVAILKQSKISVIRINTSDGAYDFDIKDNKSEIIKKQLELLTKI